MHWDPAVIGREDPSLSNKMTKQIKVPCQSGRDRFWCKVPCSNRINSRTIILESVLNLNLSTTKQPDEPKASIAGRLLKPFGQSSVYLNSAFGDRVSIVIFLFPVATSSSPKSVGLYIKTETICSKRLLPPTLVPWWNWWQKCENATRDRKSIYKFTYFRSENSFLGKIYFMEGQWSLLGKIFSLFGGKWSLLEVVYYHFQIPNIPKLNRKQNVVWKW